MGRGAREASHASAITEILGDDEGAVSPSWLRRPMPDFRTDPEGYSLAWLTKLDQGVIWRGAAGRSRSAISDLRARSVLSALSCVYDDGITSASVVSPGSERERLEVKQIKNGIEVILKDMTDSARPAVELRIPSTVLQRWRPAQPRFDSTEVRLETDAWLIEADGEQTRLLRGVTRMHSDCSASALRAMLQTMRDGARSVCRLPADNPRLLEIRRDGDRDDVVLRCRNALTNTQLRFCLRPADVEQLLG